MIKYHWHFPKETDKKTNKAIEDFRSFVAGKSHDEISKDYKLKYTGDDYDFLTRRWKKKQKRTIKFIEETIVMLKNKLR